MYFMSSAWFQQIQVNISGDRDISHTNSRILVLLGQPGSFLFFFFFFAVLGPCYFVRVFSSCSKQGLLFIAVHGLLISVASLVIEHGL